MREGEPGWLYIGNGLLQYKDVNGWTDQYQDLDGPKKTADVGPLASTDARGSGRGEAGRGARHPRLLTRLCSCAAHLLIAGLSRLMVGLGRLVVGFSRHAAGLGRRVIAGLSRLLVGLRRLVAGFWRLIAEGFRQASARLSIRSVARHQRGPSKSSVLVYRPIGLMKRSSTEHPRREVGRHRSRHRLSSTQSD